MPLHLAYSWVPVAAVQIAELAARVARVSLHVAMADAAAADDDDVQPCPWAWLVCLLALQIRGCILKGKILKGCFPRQEYY